jgi:nucleoid-associated protein YgaU
MGNQHGRGTVATLMVVAAAIVVALFGVLRWDESSRVADPAPAAAPPGQTAPAQTPPVQSGESQQRRPSSEQQAAVSPASPAPAPQAGASPGAPPGAPGGAAGRPDQQTGTRAAPPEPGTPSFDVVRIEPNGESVIAGRGVPGATIELLRDGQVHARVAADGSGLFAFVPPVLPPGSHQITLQSIAPDGTRQRSRDSITVGIAEGRNTRPLVALTSPDKPTVVLSSPEPLDAKTAEAPGSPASADQQQASAGPPSPTGSIAGSGAGSPRQSVKIVTVEAEDGGRLFVSGQAAAGATVRLYLNETFIAPGGVGGDGSVSFAIGRGVKPGEYRIRLDDVDPVSGSVKSRAEVAFNVPTPVLVPAPPAVQPPVTNPLPAVTARATPPAAPAGRPTASDPASTADPAARANPQVASAVPEPRDLPPGAVVIPDINTSIISRGDNLWRLSQRTYGNGLRYTVIFGANRGQIRNPNLIYPGQVFVLPADSAQKAN